MTVKYHVLFRACDKIESVHKVARPYGLSKAEIIKVSFYSMYQALQNSANQYRFSVIGDSLSKEMLDFFQRFNDVRVDNSLLGSAARSLQKQIDMALEIPDDEWVYMCEDDYLHTSYAFEYLSEFVKNRQKYLQTSGKKKNYMNRIIGDLAKTPLIIHTPDYPDRYDPTWKRQSFIFLSKYCHWRQISNTTHTILLQSSTIKRFEEHIKASAVGPSDSKLSERVYGRMLFRNKALCVSPIHGLSTHMTEGIMTPLVDWRAICQDNIEQMKTRGLWVD
ncbi:MAG: hypothetical protein H8D23_10560 [Candidatus Brocadiales bacterium]|nr:hypothetical protein [Candidatus Brocadiales bacterium]